MHLQPSTNNVSVKKRAVLSSIDPNIVNEVNRKEYNKNLSAKDGHLKVPTSNAACKSIEKLSCTDLEQVWGTLKEQSLAKFNPSPLHEFCHVKKPTTPYKRPIQQVTTDLEVKFRNMFVADQPQSEAALFLSGVRAPPLSLSNARSAEPQENKNSLKKLMAMAIQSLNYLLPRAAEITEDLLHDCTVEEQQYYQENIAVTTREALRMNVDTVGQDNDLWLLFKSNRFTGSICYPLCTYSKNKKPNWTKKFSSTFAPSDVVTKAMQDGISYEGDGRDAYLKKNPNKKIISARIFVHPLVPWLGYSADGIVFENDLPTKLLEIKVPVKGNKFPPNTVQKELEYLDANGHLKHKHRYYGQVQLGMALYNLSACDFLNYCICADDIVSDTVMFDETFVLDLLERLATVYFRCHISAEIINQHIG
ncbi:Actin cytoskeleton-regulatory complex protein END3 [Frankliniella fusca]|uniref:Actin cytoskeleton-regulatory complex protein END3 n=1 Tax=Frankliniella fusca TaxID=407009 RepID=A0AAE1HF04_9NEOP|nr:Actin cytoskeleton-regulatory complex protein END3 [Frankliniella fusca]